MSASAVMVETGEGNSTATAGATAWAACFSGKGRGRGPRSEFMDDAEMDAVRALADFAQMALREREGHGGDDSGRTEVEDLSLTEKSDGPMSRKRAKGDPSSPATGDIVQKAPLETRERWVDAISPILHQRQTTRQVKDHHQQQQDMKEGGECSGDGMRPDAEQNSFQVSRPACRCFNQRGRQNLTEVEKEARRLRRVLANRASARQTILRRKALCEELAKKAAELSEENDNMKMERDAAMEEYLSLKDRNLKLKEQIAERTLECEVQEQHPSPSTKARQKPPEQGGSPLPQVPCVSPFVKHSCIVSGRSSICQEKGVLMPLPGPVSCFPVPPHWSPWLCPVPYLQPGLCSVRLRGHGKGDYAGADSISKSIPAAKKKTGGAADRTSELPWESCPPRKSQHMRQEGRPTSSARTTYPEHAGRPSPGSGARPAALEETHAGQLRRVRGMMTGTSMAAEARRRRRRELTKLRSLRGLDPRMSSKKSTRMEKTGSEENPIGHLIR